MPNPAMRRLRVGLLALPVLFALATTAVPAAAAERRIELVPMVGFRGGATLDSNQTAVAPAEADPSVSYGLDLVVYLRPDAWFETFWDRQTLRFTADPDVFGAGRFDFNVDYLQFGAGYEGRPDAKVSPFVAASLGLTHYAADAGNVDSSTGVSGTLAGGFKVPAGKRVAFRFEVRGYATVTDAAVSATCGPGCVVQFASSGWYQFSARAGLVIRL